MAITVADKMTAIADAIRAKTGGTEPLTLDGMATAIAGIEGGGGASVEDDIINRSISGAYVNDRVTNVADYAFRECTKLTSLSFPSAKSVGTNAMYGCNSLVAVDLPACTSISENAFNGCSNLSALNLPKLKKIDGYALRHCYALRAVDFPVLTSLGSYAFGDCRGLTAVILRVTGSVCTLVNTTAFANCYHFHGTVNSTYNPNGDKDGFIYVPRTLANGSDGVAAYQAAKNWSTFASQFRALEDYTVDGTITGALDESKI